MKRKNILKWLFLSYLMCFLIFGEAQNDAQNEVPNEIINKNPSKKVETIIADKNKEFANLNITVNKIKPIQISPSSTSGSNIFFEIPKEYSNYTYFVTSREEEIPHKLTVNDKDVLIDRIIYRENFKIGIDYEIVNSLENYSNKNNNTDIIKIDSSLLTDKNIFISVYNKDTKDVVKIYKYERKIRKPRSFVDTPNFGTIYLGPIRPGFRFYRTYQVAENLWWFYQANGGRQFSEAPLKNIDNLEVDPLNRKFLSRIFLGSHYDFIGRASYGPINDVNTGQIPIFEYQIPVNLSLTQGGNSANIKIETFQETYLDNGYYPGWKASGVLSTPAIRSYWRHGLFEATNIWYSIYAQAEYIGEDAEYVAGMYELDNTDGKLFFVQISHDLTTPAGPKNPLFDKIQFLLQRGIFKAEATVKKNELTNQKSGKLVPFSIFKGNLQNPNTSGKPQRALYYAEYGGNYSVETRGDSDERGITINKTKDRLTSGIVMPDAVGTGLYTVELRYKNEYGDYLQYDLNGGTISNYDKFIIKYLDNREESNATIDFSKLPKNTYGIFDKDATGIIKAKQTNAQSKELTLTIDNNKQIINTVNTNGINIPKSQKVSSLKVTRNSDNKVFEKRFPIVGQNTEIPVDDVTFGFQRNGDLLIRKNTIVTGEDTYTLEAFDKDNLPLGKMNIKVIKDKVDNVGDLKYTLNKLLLDSNLDGFIKLNGDFSKNSGSNYSNLLSKMIKETSGSNNSSVLSKLNIKNIVSVGDYIINNNDPNLDKLTKNRELLTTINNSHIFSSYDNNSEEGFVIKTGSNFSNISDLLELNIKKNNLTNGNVIKVIYQDDMDQYKSFRLIIDVENNSYSYLKYDVNMTNLQLTQAYTFNLMPDNIHASGEIEENNNRNLKIRKTQGEINSVKKYLNLFDLSEITMKIDNFTKTNLKNLSYTSVNSNYSLDFEKYLNSNSKINGLNLNIQKIKREFTDEIVTIKYLYNDLIPIGEMELKLYSSKDPLVYGEGLLDLSVLKQMLKENNSYGNVFWYINLKPYTNTNKSISVSDDTLWRSKENIGHISTFDNFPWILNNWSSPTRTHINNINGEFYTFSDGYKILTDKIDKITVEKNNTIVDEFNFNSNGSTFNTTNNPRANDSSKINDLRFGINSNGGLIVGGINDKDNSGTYRLNFYKDNIKKGEYLLHVYEREVDKPLPNVKTEDTLIIEIDKRIKQLFNKNDQVWVLLLNSKEIQFRFANSPDGSSTRSIQTDEFYKMRTQNNDSNNLNNLLNFLSNLASESSGFYLSNLKNIGDFTYLPNSKRYEDSKNKLLISFNTLIPIFYMYKSDFENSDEIEREMYYVDNSMSKRIKIIIRFVGDDKKTIVINDDVSNMTLGTSKKSLYSVENIKDLILFNKNIISTSSSNFSTSITPQTTTREYVKVQDTKNSNKITFDIYRYAKAFLTEERTYTIKYYGIELQDIKFNITNKGTEGSANIDMSSNNTGVWDNFIEKTPKTDTLIGDRTKFTLTNISGDIIDTRITTGDITNLSLIQNNAKKIELSDDKGNSSSSNVQADSKGKIQATLGSLQIGIEGTDTQKYAGFLFIDKKTRDYIPKVITILAKDEHDNLLSKFTLNTIVDRPKELGKITLTISDKLYQYMSNPTKPLMYINKDGKISNSLNGVEIGEDYKNFVKLDLTEIKKVTEISDTNTITWKDEIPDRTKLRDKVHSQKYSLTEDGIELPIISTFADLKNGIKLPKTFLELDGSGTQSDKLTFTNNSNSIPYSFTYEIVKDIDVAENIYGTINTFSIPENKKVIFSTTQKTNDNSTLNISDFIKIKTLYNNTDTYNLNDYNFVYNNTKISGESTKDFSIYQLNMVYNGKEKNEIAIKKLNNYYTDSFQEKFDIYYKNVKLGTYYLTFENIPPIWTGSSSLNLSDFGINTSTSWTNNTSGTLVRDNGGTYNLTNSVGNYPYVNVSDMNKLQIVIRKKGSSETPQTLTYSNGKFEYTDKINNTPVLKLEFYNNGKSVKVTKLSEINNDSTNTVYEITFNYVDTSKNITKNIGKYDFSITRNEKDLGKVILQAVPSKIVNPLVLENGKYKIVNNGTFENTWKIVQFDKQSEAQNIKVKQWLKLNEVKPLTTSNNKFEFSEINTNLGMKKESITFNNTNKNLIDLITTVKYEYMLPERYQLDSSNRPLGKNTFITFIDENNKYYKLEVEYRYDLVEKQTATAKLIMTDLNEEEFTFSGNSSSKGSINEANNKKDTKGKTVSLTEVNGFLDFTYSGEYKMKITKNNQEIKTGISNFKYADPNYDITIEGNKLKIKKKADSSFDDTLLIHIVAFEGNKEIIVGELTLKLKNESKFAIKGNKILDFGIISYSPYDTTNLARGEEIFTITGTKDKNIEFVLKNNSTEISNTSNVTQKINVKDIKILNPRKNTLNSDEYFFTMEAFAETTPNMTPGTYTGEIDVIINIIP